MENTLLNNQTRPGINGSATPLSLNKLGDMQLNPTPDAPAVEIKLTHADTPAATKSAAAAQRVWKTKFTEEDAKTYSEMLSKLPPSPRVLNASSLAEANRDAILSAHFAGRSSEEISDFYISNDANISPRKIAMIIRTGKPASGAKKSKP